MMQRWTQGTLLQRFRESAPIERVVTRVLERLDRLLSPLAQFIPLTEIEDSPAAGMQPAKPASKPEPKPVAVNRMPASHEQTHRPVAAQFTATPVSASPRMRYESGVAIEVAARQDPRASPQQLGNSRTIQAASPVEQAAKHQPSIVTSSEAPVSPATNEPAFASTGSSHPAAVDLQVQPAFHPVAVAPGSGPVTRGLPPAEVAHSRGLKPEPIPTVAAALAVHGEEGLPPTREEFLSSTQFLPIVAELQASQHSEIMSTVAFMTADETSVFLHTADALPRLPAHFAAHPPRRLHHWAAAYFQFIAQRRASFRPARWSEATARYVERMWQMAQQPVLDEPPLNAAVPRSERTMDRELARKESRLAQAEREPLAIPSAPWLDTLSPVAFLSSERLTADAIATWLGETSPKSSLAKPALSVDAFLDHAPFDTSNKASQPGQIIPYDQSLQPVELPASPWMEARSLLSDAPVASMPWSNEFASGRAHSDAQHAEPVELSMNSAAEAVPELEAPFPRVGGQWERMRSQKKWRKHGLDRPQQ